MGKHKYKVVDRTGGSCSIPRHSEFYIEYKKGEYAKAKKGTLGIMVFTTRHQAVLFLSSASPRKRHSWISKRIKRVIPIGKAIVPDSVSVWLESDADIKLFNKMDSEQRRYDKYCMAPPLGTECYPEVVVID